VNIPSRQETNSGGGILAVLLQIIDLIACGGGNYCIMSAPLEQEGQQSSWGLPSDLLSFRPLTMQPPVPSINCPLTYFFTISLTNMWTIRLS